MVILLWCYIVLLFWTYKHVFVPFLIISDKFSTCLLKVVFDDFQLQSHIPVGKEKPNVSALDVCEIKSRALSSFSDLPRNHNWD